MAGKKAGTVKHYKAPKDVPEGMVLETVDITVGARKDNPKLVIDTMLPVANAAGVLAVTEWLSEILPGEGRGPVYVAEAVRRAIVTSQTAQAGSKNGLEIAVEKIGTIVPKLHTQDVADKKKAAKEWLFDFTVRNGAPPSVKQIEEKFKGLTL